MPIGPLAQRQDAQPEVTFSPYQVLPSPGRVNANSQFPVALPNRNMFPNLLELRKQFGLGTYLAN
jgi:hypothetical protein